MLDVAVRRLSLVRTTVRDLPVRWFWTGVAAISVAFAGTVAVLLLRWPPHEDETLALFIGRGSLPHVLHTVVAERGGAPLHFVFAWAVAHLGAGLTGLRIVSLVFAVASIPAIAVLGAQLADRLVGLVAAALAAGSWVLLFHAVYGRMYSLFLLTSALSFIALLRALERTDRRSLLVWGIALLATLASHPYAGLVLVAQVVYVLVRGDRRRAALATLAVVTVAAAPFWWADVVLRDRFGVGLGGGGQQLGSPSAVAHYFWWVSGDFSAGHHAWSAPVLLLAAVGFGVLVVRRRRSALLVACVVAVTAVALMLAKLHATASPEARHVIFLLPFFSVLVATTVVEAARFRPPATAAVAVLALGVLVVAEVDWARAKTPPLFDGEPASETQARTEASAWLAATSRPNDVLLGYEPLYLTAWERDPSFSRYALPRADATLFASSLRSIPEPLGRGVWVFDASDTTNVWERQAIPYALPSPARAFEGRVFGPYLVIRSREPLETPADYLTVSKHVMEVGRALDIADADINLHAMLIAAKRIYSPTSSSRSTISR